MVFTSRVIGAGPVTKILDAQLGHRPLCRWALTQRRLSILNHPSPDSACSVAHAPAYRTSAHPKPPSVLPSMSRKRQNLLRQTALYSNPFGALSKSEMVYQSSDSATTLLQLAPAIFDYPRENLLQKPHQDCNSSLAYHSPIQILNPTQTTIT